MTQIKYKNIATELQSNVFNLINNAYGSSYNVMDGMPAGLWSGRGFPYVLVHTPEVSDEKITQTKWRMTATLTIEIVSPQESTVRIIYDEIRNLLKTNQTATRGKNAFLYRNARSAISSVFIPGKQRVNRVWNMKMEVEYVVTST